VLPGDGLVYGISIIPDHSDIFSAFSFRTVIDYYVNGQAGLHSPPLFLTATMPPSLSVEGSESDFEDSAPVQQPAKRQRLSKAASTTGSPVAQLSSTAREKRTSKPTSKMLQLSDSRLTYQASYFALTLSQQPKRQMASWKKAVHAGRKR
jgi:hypothetical protein